MSNWEFVSKDELKLVNAKTEDIRVTTVLHFTMSRKQYKEFTEFLQTVHVPYEGDGNVVTIAMHESVLMNLFQTGRLIGASEYLGKNIAELYEKYKELE